MFSFSLTSPYASGSPPNYIRRSFEISTDHRRVFIDGVSYDYAVIAHYQVEWPVRLSTRGAMFFYTHLCARQNEVDLRFLPRRFVCLVDGTISELGITGDPIGSNYGNLVFPVWLRRCNFERCVLVLVPSTRAWVPWSGAKSIQYHRKWFNCDVFSYRRVLKFRACHSIGGTDILDLWWFIWSYDPAYPS